MVPLRGSSEEVARAGGGCGDQIYSGLVPGEGEAVVTSTRWRLRADPVYEWWAWDVVNVKMFDGDDARRCAASTSARATGSGWAAANVGRRGAWGGRKDAEEVCDWDAPSAVSVSRCAR